MRGDFIYLPEQTIEPRDRSDLSGSSKKFGHIAPEEIDVLLERIVKNSCGISANDLIDTCIDALGFRGKPKNSENTIQLRIDGLMKNSRIESVENQLQIPYSANAIH